MRVLIAAQAVRMGGGLQHLLGVLPALAEAAPAHRWLVVTNRETAARLEGLPDRFTVEVHESIGLDPLRRGLFEWWRLLGQARAFDADVLLCFNSFAVPGAPCPQVLVASNALSVCPEYWRRVAALGPRVLASARLRQALLWGSLRAADRVITPSQWLADEFQRSLGLSRDRVRAVHYGLHALYFEDHERVERSTSGERKRVLAVSWHGINKDFATLVRAVALLRQRGGPAVEVALSGTPTLSPFARATADLIVQLGLEEVVTFLGELTQRELARLYRQADLFVFPTWCESFGLPPVEAAACGLPVIVPDLAVCRELLDDAARYYRPLDAESLAATMTDLLAQPEQARLLGARGAERARRYTWQRAAEATLHVLAVAAERRR